MFSDRVIQKDALYSISNVSSLCIMISCQNPYNLASLEGLLLPGEVRHLSLPLPLALPQQALLLTPLLKRAIFCLFFFMLKVQ